MLYRNKINLFLSMTPVLIGIIIYSLFGKLLFSTSLEAGQKYIEQYLSNGTLGQIVYFLVATILTIFLYFIVSWTFVLIVSILASPFNDILSKRIEALVLGKELPDFSDSVKGGIAKLFYTLANEIKKVSLIVFLTLISLVFSFVPLLSPISILIAVVLLSIEFLDFSWSRHSLSFSDCKKDLKSHLGSYIIGGLFFMLIVSVPIINLIVPSFATSYFTVLWIKNHEHRH